MLRLITTPFLLIITSVLLLPSARAQHSQVLPVKEREELAKEQIRELKNGTLIVRLPTSHRKIEAIQKLIDRGGLDEKREKRLETLKENAREENQKFSRAVVRAFRNNYNFSDIRFTFDTTTTLPADKNTERVFLNDSLQVDPGIRLQSTPIYLLRIGSTDSATSTGLEAIIITNIQNEDLRKPFPYYSRLNHFNAVIGTIFPSENQYQKNIDRTVRKLNEQLEKFYKRYGG